MYKLIYICIGCLFSVKLLAQSLSSSPNPYYYLYGNYGNESIEANSSGMILKVIFHQKDGKLCVASFDYKFKTVTLQDIKGTILSIDTLAEHDNAFSVIDPCTERYVNLSPYVYCAGNPILYIDPDGRTIDLSMMNDEQKRSYLQQIEACCSQSELFATLYSSLEASNNIFIVSYGSPIGYSGNPVAGQFVANQAGGGSVTFDSNVPAIPGPTLSEEFFHAYQYENQKGYAPGEFNKEFEAKTYATLTGLQMADGYATYRGMETFQNNIVQEQYGKDPQNISPVMVVSKTFIGDYMRHANIYADYNRRNNIGNNNYKSSTQVAPYSLQRIIQQTYKR